MTDPVPSWIEEGIVDSGFEEGIQWVTVNAPIFGAVNGYARLPKDHPWFGKHYEHIDVEIHGGLSYSRDAWIGFDTINAWDYWPGIPYHYCAEGDCDCIRWTPELVAEEARSLARKVAKAYEGRSNE